MIVRKDEVVHAMLIGKAAKPYRPHVFAVIVFCIVVYTLNGRTLCVRQPVPRDVYVYAYVHMFWFRNR